MNRCLAAAALTFALLMATQVAAEVPTIDATIYTTKGEVPLRVSLVSTPKTREHGLMDRDNLKPLDGMLFLFPEAGNYAFWMKNTRIPLDMLFVNEKNRIVYIEHSAKPYTLTPRGGHHKVNVVIELDGGRAEEEGIGIGDHVRYELPKDLDLH